MRPTMLVTTLKGLIEADCPTLIEGQPGLGKTQIVNQVAAELGRPIVHRHAPTMQPEDLGLPAICGEKRDRHLFTYPDWFPEMHRTDIADQGVILIDEMPQADNAIQKTLANMIQERELHGHIMKPGWAIVATGNRQRDRAGANRILSHLRSRVTTLAFDANLDDWCLWALGDRGDGQPRVDPIVVSFLRFKSGLLAPDMDPNVEISPNPRAWVEGVSDLMGKIPHDAELEVFSGRVGEGPAAEFKAFAKVARTMPNPDVILMNPDKHEVPTEPSVCYALVGAMAHRARANNFDRIMTFVNRMSPEFSVMVVRDSIARCPEVRDTRAFIDWAVKGGSKALI